MRKLYSKMACLKLTFLTPMLVICVVVRDGRPRRDVQCRSHPGFPLCKHNYWVASLKNSFNIETGNSSIPDIKLIRTDTTLDLSQKAEKGMRRCPRWTPISTLICRNKDNSKYGFKNLRPDLTQKGKQNLAEESHP